MLECENSAVLLSELEMMPSGQVRCREEEGWISRNGNKPIDDPIQHDDFTVGPAFLKGLPLEILDHLCYAALLAVVTLHKSSCTSLDRINVGDQIFGVWVPYSRRVF